MKEQKSLITGITGFVGSHLAELLLEKGESVYGIKRWRSPMDNLTEIKDKIHFEDCDLTDGISTLNIIDKLRPDTIFHLAAQSYVKFSFDNPSNTIINNTLPITNLLESIRKLKKEDDYNPSIAVITSSEVYGQVTKKDLPITETCPLRPQSPYGVSKATEDLLAYQYFCSYGLNTKRARTFTHSGARRGEVFFESAFIKQIVKIEKDIQEPVIHVGNLNSIRTLAHVKDAVRAYWLMAKKCPAGEVYNIGGSTTMTVGQYLEKMIELSNLNRSKIKIKVDKTLLRPSDVTLQIPCCDKFKKATGWKPEIDYTRIFTDLLDYWRNELK